MESLEDRSLFESIVKLVKSEQILLRKTCLMEDFEDLFLLLCLRLWEMDKPRLWEIKTQESGVN